MASKMQELPPPEGYQPLNFARKPAKKFLPAKALVALYLTGVCYGTYMLKRNITNYDKKLVEERSSMLALLPMIFAERDREYLKQLRRNFDEETELMKNVDGWVVGTYYGERVFKTLPPDTLYKRNMKEYFAHADEEAYMKKSKLFLFS
ncbi:NADH dehydrogenase [ubiquinone] 1 alpha subcomplex subunit 13-like [Nilaparvata lugens]|uniref:NADH dehydrogenase [ubiquinone] 1 alpha subcomplex subunit 13-like n=1 Tax=Nilaparvata lugens TaxID=108931 RepID=UPI00193C8EED|nr:NADH dehydrogenase [ubiquinone] 1 alpha subcomplex subunit 13-like [Nilaparvata lugens]XP_039291317.1 NADH dehydrogenase [ubiquinone] 1 alpha subcomplex subunit 13-like [Nilaparvata lugens]XP_039291318.1 NADH dehydrogenase [ubiquinone] 1 alpha subcomplex subunit 13 [Nilaparvata lugens]XP_039291319.1 NADH dehydrogenase [ubiquinone] 1 alpha subcomplex subunit 13 [Nilaparvata lugens]XP_039291320.1 NADH dehydrogenase [ubiquinone] 1 alpha subcomplex subunit 13 [Nilaparvata lugens]XP_039291382.1 